MIEKTDLEIKLEILQIKLKFESNLANRKKILNEIREIEQLLKEEVKYNDN